MSATATEENSEARIRAFLAEHGIVPQEARELRVNAKRLAEQLGVPPSAVIAELGVMTPDELSAALHLMRWQARQLATALGMNSTTLRRYLSGAQLVSPEFEAWIRMLVPPAVTQWWNTRPGEVRQVEAFLVAQDIETLRFAVTFGNAPLDMNAPRRFWLTRPDYVETWCKTWRDVHAAQPMPEGWRKPELGPEILE